MLWVNQSSWDEDECLMQSDVSTQAIPINKCTTSGLIYITENRKSEEMMTTLMIIQYYHFCKWRNKFPSNTFTLWVTSQQDFFFFTPKRIRKEPQKISLEGKNYNQILSKRDRMSFQFTERLGLKAEQKKTAKQIWIKRTDQADRLEQGHTSKRNK